MKYTLYINQLKAIELGITNLNQAHIFDLLTTASSWASVEIINNEYFYWVSRQAICRELVLLNLKPDTVYRHLKSLEKIGLIIYKKLNKKDCVRITKKGGKYLSNTTKITMSEMNPKRLGNKSEKGSKLGNESEKDSEMNPTYQTTSINQLKKKSTKKKITIYSEKVLNFIPTQKTAITFQNKYPLLLKKDYLELLEQFKDQALNRKQPFKDLNAGFRIYLNKGYVEPVKQVVRKNKINSFRDLGDTVKAKQRGNIKSGLPEQILIN
jgi:DNA-binding MarR family transcriptional regulator